MSVAVIYLLIAGIGGILAGAIAYSRSGNASDAWMYFIIGLIIPIVGIIAACFVKTPPRPPGWYQDPWDGALIRWYDGATWTWHTQPTRAPV